MKAPPRGFDSALLQDALEQHWHLPIRKLEYCPVGFGAHHWRATTTTDSRDLFLTLHELDLVGRGGTDRAANFILLERTFSTATWLSRVSGLDFVVGPLQDRAGHAIRSLADQFALSVYPWLDAEPIVDPDGGRTAEIIARLHTVSSELPPGLATTEDFAIPHRGALQDALANLDTPWRTGPYAEPARGQLVEHAAGVRSLMRFYDQLAQRAAAGPKSDWVITHGEPGGPNLLQSADGSLHLVDWDTVLLAPRERDLWELQSTAAGLDAYAAAAAAPIDERRLPLYEAWYALAEIAVYLAVFRAPHAGDANDMTSWQNFLMFLPTRERWQELEAFDD